ncbi:MAG: hypothetical protein ACI86M_003342 [Saprospiraceae bacterium]|jgi:uncharacterized protein (UPF0216 family)
MNYLKFTKFIYLIFAIGFSIEYLPCVVMELSDATATITVKCLVQFLLRIFEESTGLLVEDILKIILYQLFKYRW